MTTKLIFVRHSQSQVDPERPASQWGLAEAGRERCTALADRLAGYHPDLIATSVEPKAQQTGALAAQRLGLPCETAAGLHEHLRERAGWLDQPAFEQAVAAFFERPGMLVFGEETADQACERFEGAVRSVLAAHAGKTVAIVAHGTVITLFVARCAGVEPVSFWKRLHMPAIVVMSLPELELLEVVERVEIRDWRSGM
jgi:broad specificity phosphatase PhoE